MWRRLAVIADMLLLVPVLSVFQNVEFPLLLQRKYTAKERQARVNDLLEKVGLATHAAHRIRYGAT